ncbi:MAG: CYTH domain-containing protein, partial [Candidatus Abyssubacteria bacterium]|nr:CYTH domain-containing protein [Candidatus Abyssubacteria bacterium]
MFECEVRFTIEDIAAFKQRLEELGAELLFPYEFTDHYFRPRGGEWDLSEKNLRIRHWATPPEPTTVFFVKTEIVTIGDLQFKRALYPQGKVPLFSGSPEECRSLLDDLGFEPWFDVAKKDAAIWEVAKHGFKTVAEFIEGLGWTGELEFEGEDPQQ